MCVVLTAVDKSVVNVIGYVASVDQLYAIDSSRRGILLSEDSGLTWYGTSIQRFIWAASQGADFTAAVPVPWVQGAGLTGAPPGVPYVVGSWGGTHYASFTLHRRGHTSEHNGFSRYEAPGTCSQARRGICTKPVRTFCIHPVCTQSRVHRVNQKLQER